MAGLILLFPLLPLGAVSSQAAMTVAAPEKTPFVTGFRQSVASQPNVDRNMTYGALLHKVAVIGKDNRRALKPPYTKIARSIGVLTFPNGRGCTAFCVGKDLVMTAAHCFYSPRRRKRHKKRGLQFAKFVLLSGRFQRAYAFVKGRNKREAENNIIVSRRNYIDNVASFRRDWAIARLSKPICKAPLDLVSMPMQELSKKARKDRMVMIGIHGDKLRKGLLLSPNCRLRRSIKLRTSLGRKVGLGRATILHSCDMTKGSSGAPIIVNTKNGAKVVAINVGVVGWKRWRQSGNRRKRIIDRGRENIGVLTGPLQKIVEKLRKEQLLTTDEEIRQLQKLLNQAGLNAGPVDGRAGRRTKQAITRFEKRHGLPATGIATSSLLNALGAGKAAR